MAGFKEAQFDERLKSSADARRAMLVRSQTRSPAEDDALAARRAERQAVAEARTTRLAEREVARQVEAARLRAEQAAMCEQVAADRVRDAAEASAHASKLQADQKAARDARYAARKARKRG